MPKLSDIIKQTIGDSATDLMSQAGVTQAIASAIGDEVDSRQSAIAYAIANINTTPTFYDTQSALDWLTIHGNFRNTKFSNFEFTGYSFAGVDFTEASFDTMIFFQDDFTNTNFFACQFYATIFKDNCSLLSANFDNAVFKGFSGAEGVANEATLIQNYFSMDQLEHAVALEFYFNTLPENYDYMWGQTRIFQALNPALTMGNGRILHNGEYYHAYYSSWVLDNEPPV